ncbi:hypothetical protein [uncultured Limosilactobacillus sp.]|uniref:hypothetical protein n=1 Tax=uncultured Limosilactobacillus sp. TaxID=2837629 RepID=UPI002585239B|nr:hypothetical protein [uncultured Limosilactobacillus sp.]
MSRYDQQSIEQLGIDKVKDELWDIKKWVSNFISENDKTPLLDGQILLYSSEIHSNANLDTSIPCQIKSTMAKNVNKYHSYHRLSRDDLNGIAKLGGALLLVVWLKNPRDYKIYYQKLTPLYINELLKKSKAKNPSIPLTRFPSDSDKKLNVLRQVAFDLNATVANQLIKVKNPDKVILPTYMLDPNDFEKTMEGLKNQYLTIYAENGGVFQPLALVNDDDIELIKTDLGDNNVKFGDMGPFTIKRFTKQKKSDSEPVVNFVTGAHGKLIISVYDIYQKKNRVTIKVDKADNVSDQITNIKAMKYLITNGKIVLNDEIIDLSKNIVPLADEKLREINGWINDLTIIKEVSQKLNIDFYHDYGNEGLISQLNILLNFVNDRENLSDSEFVPGVFNYGDKLIGVIKTRNDYWNFFDEDLINYIQVFEALKSNKDQIIELNPYLVAEQNQNSITKYIGYDFNIIFRWFSSHKDSFKSEVVRNQANIFCEDLIESIESSNKNTLRNINKLQLMIGHFEDARLFLNHMLIQRKMGIKISKYDNERLNKIANTDNGVKQLYADYLLNVESDKDVIKNIAREDLNWLSQLHVIDLNEV